MQFLFSAPNFEGGGQLPGPLHRGLFKIKWSDHNRWLYIVTAIVDLLSCSVISINRNVCTLLSWCC